jgi:hypothetical protein
LAKVSVSKDAQSSIAIVMPQHPTQTFALLQLSSRLPNVRINFEQPVAESLVISLGVIML